MLIFSLSFLTLALQAAAHDCPPPDSQPLNPEQVRASLGAGAAQAPGFDSEQVSRVFKGKKLVCSLFDPVKGMRCRGRMDGYPNDVTFFIPPGYKPTEKTDLVLHLHGLFMERKELGNRLENYDDMLSEFDLGGMLAQSKRNSIMIVPDGGRDNRAFAREFSNERGFRRFMDSASRLVHASGLSQSAKPGELALVSHSGSYLAAAAILSKPCSSGRTCYRDAIHEVSLIDAAYGDETTFADFAASRPPPKKFRSIYYAGNPEAQRTRKGSLEIWRQLHPGQPDEDFTKDLVDPDRCLKRFAEPGAAFVSSDVGHHASLTKFLPALLQR